MIKMLNAPVGEDDAFEFAMEVFAAALLFSCVWAVIRLTTVHFGI